MAQLGGNFDANNVKPKEDFEVIPPGDYPVMIVKSDMTDTSTGGKMLVLELDVIDGEFKGRKLWDRLNLVNANAKAVEIAERTLSSICHAVNVLSVADSEQLHGRAMFAKVVVQPAGKDKNGVERGAKNEVKNYAPAGSAPAARPVAATPVNATPTAAVIAATAKPAAGAVPPWRKQA